MIESASVNAIHRKTLHAKQLEIQNHPARFKILPCGRRFGKTTLMLEYIYDGILLGQLTGWFAPSYKIMGDAWREAIKDLQPLISSSNASDRRIQLKNGGVLEMWSLDTPDPARSRKYHRVVIDEAGMVAGLEERWQAAIRATLMDFKGSAMIGGTPKGENYFFELFNRGLDVNQTDWCSWQLSSFDNPHIEASEIEEMKKDLTEILVRQEVYAEFVTGAGTRVKKEWLKEGAPQQPYQVHVGVDLAISTKTGADWTACVAVTRDKQGNVFILDADRIQGTFDQVLEFIKRFSSKHNPASIQIEQTQYQAAVVQELMRRTTLPVRGVRPDKDKLTRFMPLEARYEQGLVYHHPNLASWFERELLAFPLGQHDDGVDAAAYAYAALNVRKVEPQPSRQVEAWG
jgi:predicted phage terminase large subunit-like protein